MQSQFLANQGYQNKGNGYDKSQSPFYKIADKYGEPPKSMTHHLEEPHYFRDAKRTIPNQWTLDMKKETELGLMPPPWSQTSKMDDPRPFGKTLFDARHWNSPVPRYNAGMSMVWDPQGLANAKKLEKAINFGVDPNSEAFRNNYGEIHTLSNEEARKLETLDSVDMFRSEQAEERMSAVDDDKDAGAGAANFGQFKSSYWR